MGKWVARVAAGLVGLAWFLGLGGGKTLDPTYVDWALKGDWGQHLLGWLFFRNAEWTWPLGHFNTFAAPAGTSVGLTDSLPWLALFLKPLPFLPADFQYMGLRLASCFVLQGVFGARLLQGVGASPFAALAGGCLLALTPVLAYRLGHEALCAHWLILATLHLHAVDPRSLRAPFAQAVLLPVLAAGIHPYLAAMATALVLGAILRWWRIDRFATRLRAMVLSGGLVALILVLWWTFGYLGAGTEETAYGFRYYSADLLTFFNSMNRSRVLPGLPMGEGQGEGMAYPGLGNLFLSAIAVTILLSRHEARRVFRSPKVRTVLALCAAMGCFALSSKVTIAGEKILSIRRVYAPIEFLTEAFRASGRFIWPLHYLVIVGTLVLLMRYARRPRHALTSLLLVALGLQVWDQTVQFRQDRFPAREIDRLEAAAWGHVPDHYEELFVFPPPLIAGTGFECSNGRAFENSDMPLALLAYHLDLRFNGGSLARIDPEKAQAGCDALQAALDQCRLDPRTVYVVAENRRRHLEACRAAYCGEVDGLQVCVHRGNGDPLALVLAGPDRVPESPASSY